MDEYIDLDKVAKKIQLIEDKDIDYRENKSWQKLRATQTKAYISIAKEKLAYYERFEQSEFIEQKKNELKKFIEKYEVNVENEIT